LQWTCLSKNRFLLAIPFAGLQMYWPLLTLVLDHNPYTRRSIETQSQISQTGRLIIKGEIQIEDHR
jgi:hypothetical protein